MVNKINYVSVKKSIYLYEWKTMHQYVKTSSVDDAGSSICDRDK